MTNKIRIAELTSEEARQHLNAEAVLLVPMGSLEDQGTHAPMGDFMAADAVAMDIAKSARAAGVQTFVAPVIPFGGKDFFESSHGGVSLRHETLAMILNDMIGCFIRHGLKRILIVNGHGGNVPPITEVALRWRQSHGVFITSMYLWQISYGLLQKILGPERAAQSSGHGADPLTSVGLHYFPQLLRSDLMRNPTPGLKVGGVEVGGYGTLSYGGVSFQAPTEAAENAPDGVWGGDPHLCSAETGAALVAELVRLGAGFIKDHVARGFRAT
ncbi:creatininase family protein [Rhizobium miluonense]|uniref:Creatinine amidohydrolase n=1 Tax=Rhizobium miluonense TaxID=411945 RepID=A0A1C3WCY4_9HYPH|nr:creatininase family protein [Rhizobium miluonense]SCB37870.1 creatinine amidohydrolase [Rhizobium miluonense]